jgi:NDP-sugar pyrophosphorylase family protein
MKALLMAGGLGTRLRPLTYAIPKPLIPIGDRPILEILLRQLQRAGLTDAILSTGYKAELIRSYFGDGSRLGVGLSYVVEEEPLGTAGALRLVRDRLTEPFLMINGDILTRLDFGAFYREHVVSGALLTAAAARYETRIPYGVIRGDGAAIEEVEEKPVEVRHILAGIYAVSPAALDHLPDGTRVDMPDLIRAVRAAGGTVRRHDLDVFWLDVGAVADLEAANQAVASWPDV